MMSMDFTTKTPLSLAGALADLPPDFTAVHAAQGEARLQLKNAYIWLYTEMGCMQFTVYGMNQNRLRELLPPLAKHYGVEIRGDYGMILVEESGAYTDLSSQRSQGHG